MKKRGILCGLFSVCTCLWSCCDDHGGASAWESAVAGNVMFYKGGIGLVFDQSYIMRDDERNRLYGNNGNILFSGAGRNDEELVQITRERGKLRVKKERALPVEKKGCVVVYTPDSVYVLDYERNSFGKYIRGKTGIDQGKRRSLVFP